MITDKKMADRLSYVVLPVLLILTAIGIRNFLLYQREFEFFHNIYDNEIAETKSLVSRRFQSALIAAETTRAFFISSQEVTREEFGLFSSVLTKNTASGTIAMPLTIEWIDPQNKVRYVYPMNADNARIIGLDLNQYPNRLESLTMAKNTRSAVVTEPVMLWEGYPGLVIYSPIFKGDDYLGEAAVVLRLSNLLAPIAGSAQIYNKNKYIQTGNFIIPFDEDVVFTNDGERIIDAQGGLIKDPASQQYLISSKNEAVQSVIFADKTWQMEFPPDYMADVNKSVAAYIGSSSLFVLVLAVFLWLLQIQRERLSKEEARVEALIGSIGDGVIACDKDGLITFINKKSEDIFGYSSAEAVGRSYYEIWRALDNKGAIIPLEERLFYRALKKKEALSIPIGSRIYILRKDGSRIPVAPTVAPVIVNGKVEGAIVVIRDVAKDVEVDRMKTEFLSLVSHQLLTPSGSIKWLSELLLGGDFGALNEKQTKSMRGIYDSNESMIGLVNSLLNVSRIESGRLTVEPKPSNLREVAAAVIAELKNQTENKRQSLVIKSDADLPDISIDPKLIREVYKNLLTNAIKYTPANGSISVDIRKTGNSIVSEVRDSGYGIPEKDKARVFNKFYRGENILSVEKDGNGLGLYLVKQIVDVSGGKIWYESEVNKGTTFWFSLPLAGSSPKSGTVTVS